MSWQAFEAVRDYSESRGATRTVGFVLATYADEHGRGIFPSLKTICKQAKVGRKAAVDGRNWFVDNAEAALEGKRPGGTPELTFGPLIARGSLTEPLGSSVSEPPVSQANPGSSVSEPEGVRSERTAGSESEPEPEGNAQSKSEREPKAGLSQKQQAEAEERHAELAALLEQLPDSKPGPLREQTIRSIAQLEDEIAAEQEIEIWAARVPVLLDLAVAA